MTGNDNNGGFIVPTENVGFFAKIKRNIRETVQIAVLEQEIKELLPPPPVVSHKDIMALIRSIHKNIQCAHNPSHALSFIRDMLTVTRLGVNADAVFVEAGCFKGGSTAKFSLIADLLHRPLCIFDSFEGLPDNAEEHSVSTMGHSIEGWFSKGHFAGQLDEVKYNVEKHGKIESCEFIKGWFSDTMPTFTRPVAAAFIDVDLASSTRTCLQYLYPLLIPGGILCSQDGDFPLVIEVFKDNVFWENEMRNHAKPIFEGVGQKITRIRKPY